MRFLKESLGEPSSYSLFKNKKYSKVSFVEYTLTHLLMMTI